VEIEIRDARVWGGMHFRSSVDQVPSSAKKSPSGSRRTTSARSIESLLTAAERADPVTDVRSTRQPVSRDSITASYMSPPA
jgi:hypothetical protein